VRTGAAALTVGDRREPGPRVGPINTGELCAGVPGFVDRARADGAEPLWGGGRHERGGLYFAPTLLGNVRGDMEIAQSEVFGPVLTWHPFLDVA
jgi:5-carboxymethyl-2-hydroxymuconic-semialdehyde dehydrogenase